MAPSRAKLEREEFEPLIHSVADEGHSSPQTCSDSYDMADPPSHQYGDKGLDKSSVSQISVCAVGQENLSDSIPPHESYEGVHRWDPSATWTAEEEALVVRKTDVRLLSWICLMV